LFAIHPALPVAVVVLLFMSIACLVLGMERRQQTLVTPSLPHDSLFGEQHSATLASSPLPLSPSITPVEELPFSRRSVEEQSEGTIRGGAHIPNMAPTALAVEGAEMKVEEIVERTSE
jgi:hypothetical protein